jgi:hypothetical protein
VDVGRPVPAERPGQHVRGADHHVRWHDGQQQQVPAEDRRPPADRFGADDRQEEQVTRHQIGEVLAVVQQALGEDKRRQVGGEHDRPVQRHAERRPAQRGDRPGPYHSFDPRVPRIPRRVQQQRHRTAEHQQGRSRHDQQQVLHHVRAQQHVVVDGVGSLRRHRDHGQAREKRQGASARPGPDGVPARDHPRSRQVARGEDQQRQADQRHELPRGQRRRGGQRSRHATPLPDMRAS